MEIPRLACYTYKQMEIIQIKVSNRNAFFSPTSWDDTNWMFDVTAYIYGKIILLGWEHFYIVTNYYTFFYLEGRHQQLTFFNLDSMIQVPKIHVRQQTNQFVNKKWYNWFQNCTYIADYANRLHICNFYVVLILESTCYF